MQSMMRKTLQSCDLLVCQIIKKQKYTKEAITQLWFQKSGILGEADCGQT